MGKAGSDSEYRLYVGDDDLQLYSMKQIKGLQARADKLLELLRECNNIMSACPVCESNLRTWDYIDTNTVVRVGHTDDCELAKELGDA